MNASLQAAPTIDRRRFIGGSDSAAIFGVSPWSTPLDIYLLKRDEYPATGREADPGKERIFRRGKRLEPVVIDMLVEEYGVEVTKRSPPENPNRYQDPEHPFLAAEIDFEWRVSAELAERHGLDPELVGTIQNGDVKTARGFGAKKFGEEGTDEIPIEYAAQFMHGLMVTNRQLTMVAVLVSMDDVLFYFIHRDDETIAAMRAKSVSFWFDNVQAGVPPDPVNLPDVMHLFRRDRGTLIEATPEILAKFDEYRDASDTANSLTREGGVLDTLKFAIGAFMLGAEVYVEPPEELAKHILTAPDGRELLAVSLQSQQRLDTKFVRERYPMIAAECSKTSRFFVFRPKRGKK
jgi:predicted phage-related endonuclease